MNNEAYKFSTRDSTEFMVGSGLPEVTSEDNGDVLTVVEGSWAKAAPTGGNGALIVHGNLLTRALDKTWQEIHDAAPLVWMEAEGSYAPCCAVYEDEGDYVAIFVEYQQNGNIFRDYVATSASGYPVITTSPEQ